MTRRRAVRVLLVLVAFAGAGVLAGVVWHALWTPPTGVFVGDEWRIDSEGAPRDVAGTGLYVLVSAVTGILLGSGVALTSRGDEVVTLAAVAVGSVGAGLLMSVTGHALGPEDPRPLAVGQPDGTAVVADLRVEGWSPYVGFPAGALTSMAAVFLLLGGGSLRLHRDAEPGG